MEKTNLTAGVRRDMAVKNLKSIIRQWVRRHAPPITRRALVAVLIVVTALSGIATIFARQFFPSLPRGFGIVGPFLWLIATGWGAVNGYIELGPDMATFKKFFLCVDEGAVDHAD